METNFSQVPNFPLLVAILMKSDILLLLGGKKKYIYIFILDEEDFWNGAVNFCPFLLSLLCPFRGQELVACRHHPWGGFSLELQHSRGSWQPLPALLIVGGATGEEWMLPALGRARIPLGMWDERPSRSSEGLEVPRIYAGGEHFNK